MLNANSQKRLQAVISSLENSTGLTVEYTEAAGSVRCQLEGLNSCAVSRRLVKYEPIYHPIPPQGVAWVSNGRFKLAIQVELPVTRWRWNNGGIKPAAHEEVMEGGVPSICLDSLFERIRPYLPLRQFRPLAKVAFSSARFVGYDEYGCPKWAQPEEKPQSPRKGGFYPQPTSTSVEVEPALVVALAPPGAKLTDRIPLGAAATVLEALSPGEALVKRLTPSQG